MGADVHPWLNVIIIGLITFFDFFVALAKSAFEHVNENALEEACEEGPEHSGETSAGENTEESGTKGIIARKALEFIDKKERSFYNACWLIRGIAWIVIGMLYAFRPFQVLKPKLMQSLEYQTAGTKLFSWAVCIISVIALIFLEVLFSYILPDRLGNRNPESLFFKMFGFMRFITAVMAPLSFMLEKGCALLIAPFGIKLEDLEEKVSEEEIISIVNEGQENGVIDDNEAEMISNIINFDETKTKDIMTHRKRIVGVDNSMGIEEAMRFMTEATFSRFPLYDGDYDNIIGVLHLKDVAKCYASGKYTGRSLKSIARNPLFVPETMTIDNLFNQMQLKKTHMAIVVDEYGQTSGIVAMEDILEEIVGEIEDEFDSEQQTVIKGKDGSFILRGEAGLDEIAEITGLDIAEEDTENFSTLNGLLINLLGRIPADGERESVEYGNDYVFDILEVAGKMIRKCRLRKL